MQDHDSAAREGSAASRDELTRAQALALRLPHSKKDRKESDWLMKRGDEAAERARAENGGRLDGTVMANDRGSWRVTDADTNDEEAFDRAVPGSVEAMEIVERIRAADARYAQERAATAARSARALGSSRRPNCVRPVARVLARARSGLRGGSPSHSPRSSSSSSSGEPSDSDGGERPRQVATPPAGLTPGLHSSLSRIGTLRPIGLALDALLDELRPIGGAL